MIIILAIRQVKTKSFSISKVNMIQKLDLKETQWMMKVLIEWMIKWKEFSAMIVYTLIDPKNNINMVVFLICKWIVVNKFVFQELKKWILNNQLGKYLFVLKLLEVVMLGLKWLHNSKVMINLVIHIEEVVMRMSTICIMNRIIPMVVLKMIILTQMITILTMTKWLHFMTL